MPAAISGRRECGSESAPPDDRQARTGRIRGDIPFQFPHWEIPVGVNEWWLRYRFRGPSHKGDGRVMDHGTPES